MQRLRDWAASLASDERGLTTVEYAIVLCLIAVVGVGLWADFGKTVSDNLTRANDQISGPLETATTGNEN